MINRTGKQQALLHYDTESLAEMDFYKSRDVDINGFRLTVIPRKLGIPDDNDTRYRRKKTEYEIGETTNSEEVPEGKKKVKKQKKVVVVDDDEESQMLTETSVIKTVYEAVKPKKKMDKKEELAKKSRKEALGKSKKVWF